MTIFAWKRITVLGLFAWTLCACTPVPSENNNRYQLTEACKFAPRAASQHISILIMQPGALDGYDTEQMLYVDKPFQVSAFANNSWMSPPATMLSPLLIRSIESTHYFFAVATDINTSKTDYRLESALIRLQQNFLVKPSQIQLGMQVMLIHNADSRVVATKTFNETVNCPKDTPLGGVIAANQATRQLTSQITHFVMSQVRRDQT